MKIIKYLVERPTLMWSFMAAILIAGLLSFIRMPKLEDPVVPVKQAVVVVARPGASVHEMELQVAQQVEESLRTLPDVRKIMTDCQQGQATFTVEFEETVLMDEIEQHFDILRRRVNDLQQSLPPGCVDCDGILHSSKNTVTTVTDRHAPEFSSLRFTIRPSWVRLLS